MNEKKHFKLRKWVKISLFVILLGIFTFSAYKLVLYYLDSKKVEKITEEVVNDVPTQEIDSTEEAELVNPPEEKTSDYWSFIETPFVEVDFNTLLEKNKDTVAWIKIENTNINYPVVQTTNNTYYLKRAFDKSYNGAGWLFMDYRNNSKDFGTNTIIYGHSMLNTTMFGTLWKTRKSSWYTNKDNWVIKVSTPTEYTLWQVFSLYNIEAENYYITTSFSSDDETQNFFDTLISRSIYNFKTELFPNDKILTLSTCTSTGENGRYVVHAKLIKREAR